MGVFRQSLTCQVDSKKTKNILKTILKMPKDMSAMEEQMKSNNESVSTVDESKTTEEPSMETSGDQFEKYIEKIYGVENNFGPHGTGGNGEIHVPACLTGTFIESNNKTFRPSSPTDPEQDGNVTTQQNGYNKTFYDPALQANIYNPTDTNGVQNGGQNGNGVHPTAGFQFNFDDNYIREADGTLILNLQVPVTNAEVPDEKNELIENFVTIFIREKIPGVRSGVLKAIESVLSTNEALVKFLIREDFCRALDEDLTANLTTPRREFDGRDCIIFGSQLKNRIEKAATNEAQQKMVKSIFRNSSYHLWYFSGILGN